MDRLILHIGWPKSGTSSIQGKLASNTDALAHLGFIYPAIERAQNAHHPACGLFINHHDPLIPPPKGDVQGLITHLDDQQHRDIHTTILSSEGFCRADSIKENLEQLTGRYTVTVVACLRNPLVWANSLMNQLLKMKLFFGDGIDLNALATEMILRDFQYPKRLQMWADAFGQENVKVVALEEGEDFCKAFFDAIAIDNQDLPETPARDGSNKSLGLGSLQFINWLYKNQVQLSQPQKSAINKRLHECVVIETPNLLSPEISNRISAQHSRIQEELAGKWLDGKPCFLIEPALSEFGDINQLHSIDREELAERVLWDETELLNKLQKDLIH